MTASYLRFPTPVDVDRSAVEAAGRLPVPLPKVNRRKVEWRTDRAGMLAILADAGRKIGERTDDGAWRGVTNDEEAITLATNGWSDPVADIVSQARGVKVGRMRSLVPQLSYLDEPGDDVDVSRFLDREEMHFESLVPSGIDNTGRGAVRLVVEPAVSSGIGTEEIVQRGAIMLAVVWALERAGCRTAISYQSHLTVECEDSRQVTLRADVKRFRDPVDVRGLAFWLAHPAASRVVVFAAVQMSQYATDGKGSRNITIGWGHREPVDPNAIECPMLHTRNMPTVEQWIQTVAKKGGVSWN
jgi:hypothetical protein